MFRAYSIYVIMFLALIVGLWTILAYGSSLPAPADMSGEWLVAWETARPPNAGTPTVDPATGDSPSRMLIEQSGRFFNVSFDGGGRVALKLVDGTLLQGARGPGRNGRLAGRQWTVTLSEVADSGVFRLELGGPSAHSGTAQRPPQPDPARDRAGAGADGGTRTESATAGDAQH